jgi:hypothetical protein
MAVIVSAPVEEYGAPPLLGEAPGQIDGGIHGSGGRRLAHNNGAKTPVAPRSEMSGARAREWSEMPVGQRRQRGRVARVRAEGSGRRA